MPIPEIREDRLIFEVMRMFSLIDPEREWSQTRDAKPPSALSHQSQYKAFRSQLRWVFLEALNQTRSWPVRLWNRFMVSWVCDSHLTDWMLHIRHNYLTGVKTDPLWEGRRKVISR